jgi:hypothetical protein
MEQPSRHQMHRWTDQEGFMWECDEYDHGPFCRLCRVVGHVGELKVEPTCPS